MVYLTDLNAQLNICARIIIQDLYILSVSLKIFFQINFSVLTSEFRTGKNHNTYSQEACHKLAAIFFLKNYIIVPITKFLLQIIFNSFE